MFGDDMPPGSPVYVGSEDEAYCLVRGHLPGRPANAECDALRASAPRMTGPLPAATFRVRDGVSFRLPEITALPQRLYILWQTGPSCPVGSDCVPAPGSADNAFTLVDVVPNKSRGCVHSFGGAFGDGFGQLMSKDPSNPASPATNSLRLASNLLPPLEHELIDDGDAFEDSFSYYLDYAEDSAREAAARLEEARAEEIELLRSEAELAARRESAALAQEEVVAAVCGGDRPEAECDIERVPSITLGELGFISDPTILEPPADDWRPTECPDLISTFSDEWRSVDKTDARAVKRLLMGGLECSRWLALLAIGNATLTNVPARVVTEWRSGGRGEFSEVGGQVRQEYIRIYQNFLDLRQAIDDIDDVYRTAKINVTLTANEINRLESGFLEDAGCWLSTIGDSLMLVVVAAGTIVATVTAGPAGTAVGVLLFAATLASSAGDLAEGLDALGRVEEICSEEEFSAQQKALAAFRDTSNSMDSMVEVLDDVARLITVLASADGNLRDLERRVEIARARRGIENRLAEATTSAGQSSWRALRGVKARRARDALSRAQRLSFIARRAMEYRLVQDMRTLSVEEPFVAAPSTWVNEVFTLDTASSEPDDGAMGSEPGARVLIAGEALEDYVQSLRDFVFGYPFHRRFSEGRDLQTVNLAALANAELPEIDSDGDGEPDPVDAEGVPASAFWKRMLYKCAGHDGLWLAGVLPDADGGVPNINDLSPDFVPCTDPTDESTPPVVEYAKYQFFIPSPLAGYFSERLADGNFNFRVNRVAVNVVGSAVLDCSRAARTEECYAGANIQYDMRQSGAVTLENFESEHLGFHSEPGVIARARALAAERYLTNPLSSADRALLTDYQRAEWWGRPLSGLYVVRIHGAPEIVWQNLEDIQILLTYDYWTRQE